MLRAHLRQLIPRNFGGAISMPNTQKSGPNIMVKKTPQPTLRNGRGSRTNSKTSHQIPARLIEADGARASAGPRSAQLIQLVAETADGCLRKIRLGRLQRVFHRAFASSPHCLRWTLISAWTTHASGM